MKKKRRKAPIILAIIAVVIVGFISVSCALAPKPGVFVTTTTATRGDLQESISTGGLVVSEKQKVYFAKVNGVIANVNVQSGDSVSAGSMLISYDMEQMDDSLAQATLQQKRSEAGYKGAISDNTDNQAKLNEANINLGVLNQQIKDDKALLKELQEELSTNQRGAENGLARELYNLNESASQIQKELSLLEPGSAEYAEKEAELEDINAQISLKQYEQSQVAGGDYVADMNKRIAEVTERLQGYEEYKARMESQKSSSEMAAMDKYDKTQFEVDRELAAMSYQDAEADYNTAKEGVCAEFDGIVTECNTVPGSSVLEGTPLLTLESSKEVKVSFDATKHDLEKLSIGQKAAITVCGQSYEGEVSKINRMASPNATGTPMVGAEVRILNPDDKLILGMDAKLQIKTRSAENVLLIPSEVINADRDGDFLYVVENGVIVKKSIICGISSDTMTEVMEGITEEDQIVLTALTGIDEGMAVTVLPELPQLQ